MALYIKEIISDPDMDVCPEYISTGYMYNVDETNIELLDLTEDILESAIKGETVAAPPGWSATPGAPSQPAGGGGKSLGTTTTTTTSGGSSGGGKPRSMSGGGYNR